MVKNDDYTCFFYLNRINKFCRESLVKTTVSFRKIFLDRFLYVAVKYGLEMVIPVFRRSTRNLPSFLFEFPSLTSDFSRIFKIFLLDFFIEKNFFL